LGLDNYPEPYPCKTLEETGKLKLVRDVDGDSDCKFTNCPFTTLPTGCWIRGKVFNKFVQECCDESLYEDKTREELSYIIQSLNEHYRRSYPDKETITNIDEHAKLQQLIEYLEILLSIEEWDGTLVAWF
jgi:hypothetical protein